MEVKRLMRKEVENSTSSSSKKENAKKRCGAPYTHCTSFYECLWAAQPKIRKKRQ